MQPYAIVGLGVYHTAVTGDDAAKAGSQLYSGTSKGAPLGIGINVPISDGISAGGEAVYNRMFGESYSNNQDFPGGDITTFNAGRPREALVGSPLDQSTRNPAPSAGSAKQAVVSFGTRRLFSIPRPRCCR